ncbi:hypothetical protein ANCCAN_03686 [Ancylostoma caninum]|uniref:Uncharacterized protein n=1 Tax=Ancylostoma caninum TaxID=29170 RepID=A0A368H3P6_ANCCA|nr:hypothetical protein ANCCAN_03686 [Ancylostoma caninum]
MNNKLNVQAGAGQFVPTLPFAPIAYASHAQKAQKMAFRSVKRDKKPDEKPPEGQPRATAGGSDGTQS